MFSYGLVVSVRRELSANILERRGHVGESGLVELQHRDHCCRRWQWTNSISAPGVRQDRKHLRGEDCHPEAVVIDPDDDPKDMKM